VAWLLAMLLRPGEEENEEKQRPVAPFMPPKKLSVDKREIWAKANQPRPQNQQPSSRFLGLFSVSSSCWFSGSGG
jgi:hypothetical protein